MSFSSHLEQLDITNERLSNLVARLYRVSEALDGSYPVDASLAKDRTSAPSIHSLFAEKIVMGQNYIDQLASLVTRIEESVVGADDKGRSTLMPSTKSPAGY